MKNKLDYMNIAQLKAIHKRAVQDIIKMKASTVSPRINIQLFAQQHEFAIQEQQKFIDEVADKIRILENLENIFKR
ncbi:MAG: hypothetical protein N3B21_19370 [Clostridia bacterium]|nr:hypothetical protein [Clostridia bacterium]